MVVSRLFANVAPVVRRNIATSAVRRSGHGHDGTNAPGASLPFSIKNRYGLCVKFVIYFGTGVGLPYFIVRHQLLK